MKEVGCNVTLSKRGTNEGQENVVKIRKPLHGTTTGLKHMRKPKPLHGTERGFETYIKKKGYLVKPMVSFLTIMYALTLL